MMQYVIHTKIETRRTEAVLTVCAMTTDNDSVFTDHAMFPPEAREDEKGSFRWT